MDKSIKKDLKKVWHFIWDDDSIWSWMVNVILAFVVIKFLLYPGIGLVLGTTHPVVAVVSGSMEHKTVPPCLQRVNPTSSSVCLKYADTDYGICGATFDEKMRVNFDFFWETCGDFYRQYNINKMQFEEFPLKNGFNTGDIIVLVGKEPEDIKIGEVIVFAGGGADPIIHRVIRSWEENSKYYFTTKGDHNPDIITRIQEDKILEDRVIGKAVFKIPYLGYIKIWFVELLDLLRLDFVKRLFS